METIRKLLQTIDEIQQQISTATETIYESDNIIDDFYNIVGALQDSQLELNIAREKLTAELQRLENKTINHDS